MRAFASLKRPALGLMRLSIGASTRPFAPSMRVSAQALKAGRVNRTSSYATYNSFRGRPQYSFSPYALLTNYRFVGGVGGTFLIIYLWGLEEAPVSHRRRFMLISRSMENMIGEQQYKQMINEFQGRILPPNHPTALRVESIMRRLIKVSGISQDTNWRIHVIHDPRQPPNAFVMPSGKVFVFDSILPICANDDGLATVLSHETAHQLARHTGENLSKTPFYIALGIIMYTLTGSDYLNQLLISSVLRLPASREMESEADYIGLLMMSKACFNPDEAVHLWERMSKFEKSQGGRIPLEFLSTHPASTHRIENIKRWLPEAHAARDAANCDVLGGYYDSFFGR